MISSILQEVEQLGQFIRWNMVCTRSQSQFLVPSGTKAHFTRFLDHSTPTLNLFRVLPNARYNTKINKYLILNDIFTVKLQLNKFKTNRYLNT